MKKFNLILILCFLSLSSIFAQEDSIKNKKELIIDVPIEKNKYSKYKEDKYLEPPSIQELDKNKIKDLDIDMGVDVDKTTKEVEKVNIDIMKKF